MQHKVLNLRPVVQEDADFLFELFSIVKLDELGARSWDSELSHRLLRQQFQAHEHHYHHLFEGGDDYLIRVEEASIGRMIVYRTPSVIHLADIALMPTHRNTGIGSTLIHRLQKEAVMTGKRVRLNVMKTSPAVRFYLRLGFNVVTANDVQELMEWRIGTESGTPDDGAGDRSLLAQRKPGLRKATIAGLAACNWAPRVCAQRRRSLE